MISDYLEYERLLWHESVRPSLAALGVSLDGQRVLDIGCGYGGMLKGLGESFAIAEGIGLDLDPEMIAIARRERIARTTFLEQDVFAFVAAKPFDAVFLRDVLEHIIDPERALACALRVTRPNGLVFISYAPFYGPFGGHQHNGTGFFSHLPWLHMLPDGLFRRLIRVRGNAYKAGDRLAQDIETVLQTRLSLRGLDRMLARADVSVLDRVRYLVRPDYRIKFGLPEVALPRLPVGVAEWLCTGETLVLRRR